MNRVHHRHAIELVSRRWRGGHDPAVAETRRDILIYAQVDGLKAKVAELAAAKAEVVLRPRAKAADGTELAKAKAEAADAKNRLAEVEAAAQALESENQKLRRRRATASSSSPRTGLCTSKTSCASTSRRPPRTARAPMERAMKAVIGFDDSGAKRAEAKKAEHAKRALGGLAVFFGSGRVLLCATLFTVGHCQERIIRSSSAHQNQVAIHQNRRLRPSRRGPSRDRRCLDTVHDLVRRGRERTRARPAEP